jgi:serine/threonine protein kinase
MDVGPDPRALDATGRLGQVLKDKWRLDELLGVGGMAAVYAATHRNGKRVAIKMLHREYSADAEVKARFLREGYLVNKVIHPGVVGVLDDDSAPDGAVFLVMDLLEGESLEQRRNRKGGALPAAEVLSIADQVLDVLAAAHAVGMVHRDMKPENLFLCRDGSVKVLDFGIARLRELSARIGATQNGSTTMGTPAFMPPEQARGAWDTVDSRTDLWGLGASMFTMLTNTIVHEANNLGDLLVAAMTKPSPSLAERLPGASPELVAVVDKALAFDQNDRWPDARAMQTAVRDAYRLTAGKAVMDAPPLAISIADKMQPEPPPEFLPQGVADIAAATQLAPPLVSQPFSSPPNTPVMHPRQGGYPGRAAPQLNPIGPISFGPPPAMPQFFSPQPAPPLPSQALPFAAPEGERPPAQMWLLLVTGALLSGIVGLILIAFLAKHREPAPGSASAMPSVSVVPSVSAKTSAHP